jgi:hypothetical protein
MDIPLSFYALSEIALNKRFRSRNVDCGRELRFLPAQSRRIVFLFTAKSINGKASLS